MKNTVSSQHMPGPWQFDRDSGEHFLPIDGDRSVKVYKTAAGDYAMTLHCESATLDEQVEFFDTLKQAKTAAIAKATGSASC